MLDLNKLLRISRVREVKISEKFTSTDNHLNSLDFCGIEKVFILGEKKELG
jgi:hypothetical protein